MRVPSDRLPQRLRRLCTACVKAPLGRLTGPDGADADVSTPFTPADDDDCGDDGAYAAAFRIEAFARGTCTCPDGAFICRPCGQLLPRSDTVYRRIWTWRTRYSREGIGTGIGEGTEGVKCGRGAACLAAQEIEGELDCGTDEDHDSGGGGGGGSSGGSGTPDTTVEAHGPSAGGSGNGSSGPGSPAHEYRGEAGYLRQEIEGIGGVVRGKVKRRRRVGRPVREFEDEREHAVFLGREARGERRSWCGWCERVVPSKSE